MNVAAIQGANGVLEIGPEPGVFLDVSMDFIVLWKTEVLGVKWRRQEYILNLVEVPANIQCDGWHSSGWIRYREIVAFEH